MITKHNLLTNLNGSGGEGTVGVGGAGDLLIFLQRCPTIYEMNQHHQEILKEIKRESKRKPFFCSLPESYAGHNDFSYPLNNPTERKIIKNWIKKHPNLSYREFVDLLNSLYQGKSATEKEMAGKLLGYLPNLRKQIPPNYIEKWLGNLKGWAQVDSLCQSNFSAEDLLPHWDKWKNLIQKLARSKNPNKKRAPLVLLTKPVRESEDTRLAHLAFEIIDTLKLEKEILITKAVSWLLRDLIKNHRRLVEKYLEENRNGLPKNAARETRNKLLTGRK